MNDLRNWLGKVELPLQFHSLLGKYALVSVVHNSYEDKIFANISGLAQVPSMIAKTELPKGVNETFLYDMKKHPENYDLIWGWQQDMIKKSSEFVTMETKKEAVTIQDDDVPF
jgi:hypothetical protein